MAHSDRHGELAAPVSLLVVPLADYMASTGIEHTNPVGRENVFAPLSVSLGTEPCLQIRCTCYSMG